jgi:putative acyl-CoA dehydrogenase
MHTEFSAAFHLVFHAVELLGKEEAGTAANQKKRSFVY